MTRTNQQFEVRIAQHCLAPLASGYSHVHESASKEILLSFVTHGFSYSAEFSLLRRTRANNYLNILEAIDINMSRPILCRQKKLKHKLALFGESLSRSGTI